MIEGIKNTSILDDTYNSSPTALAAAFETMNELYRASEDKKFKRKIVILGDMLELGKYTIEEHKKAGQLVVESGAKLFFTIGPRMKFAAEEARAQGFNPKNIFEFSTSDEARMAVQEKIKEGDLILIKGSQRTRAEKITEEIMAHPELKDELLVRQEKEWEGR